MATYRTGIGRSLSSRNHGGFTVVEVMAAIFIFAISLGTIVSLSNAVQYAQRSARYIDLATQSARAEIELIQGRSRESLDVNSTIDFTERLPTELPRDNLKGTVSFVPDAALPDDTLKAIALVRYMHNSQTKTVRIVAIVETGKQTDPIVSEGGDTRPNWNGFMGRMLAGRGGLSLHYQLSNATLYANTIDVQGALCLDNPGHIGSSANPSNVRVAGDWYKSVDPWACPTRPIAATTLSVHPNWIYGNVCAPGQSDLSYIFPGAGSTPYTQGYIASCTPPKIEVPRFDKAAHTSRMTMSLPSPTCGWQGGQMILEANTTYTGNIDDFYCDEILIRGDVHIKGSMTIRGKVVVDPSVGQRPVVVTDDTLSFFGTREVRAGEGMGPVFVSMYSRDETCRKSSVCSAVSEATLQEAGWPGAISIHLSSSTDFGHAIFFAPFDEVRFFTGSSSGIDGVAGQKVHIQSSTVIVEGG